MRKQAGFTLIELLTVIAIIAILAAFTFTQGPKMIENAKMRATMGAMKEISNISVMYYGDHNSYPPGYGFISWDAREVLSTDVPSFSHPEWYFTRPYTSFLKFENNPKLFDEKWSERYDTNDDGILSMGEFLPERITDGDVTLKGGYPVLVYTTESQLQHPDTAEAVNVVQSKELRPFYYFPVNKTQFKKFEKYWLEHGDSYGTYWPSASNSDPNFPWPAQTSIPPSNYDTYVLISPGPRGETFGVVPDTPACTAASKMAYHVLALQAYFRATRDLNQNGELDFDYAARTQRGEGEFYHYQYKAGNQTFEASNWLPGPDPSNLTNVENYAGKNLHGPVIFIYGGK